MSNTIILSGKPVADKIKSQIKISVENYKKEGLSPTLALLRVGERPDDIAYEARVIANCAALDISVKTFFEPIDVSTEKLIRTLTLLNQDVSVHGILLFRPLPDHIDQSLVCKVIDPVKDIDCMGDINTAKVFLGDSAGFSPCTPEAVIQILKHYNYDLSGKNVVIVNRSLVLGKPLAMLFLKENATVTICHSKTKDLEKVTAAADIVVTGVGRAKFFTKEYFSENSIIVDVGINFSDGKMCGDVDFGQVSDYVEAITPVPGGVGGVTSTILLSHIIEAIKLQTKA